MSTSNDTTQIPYGYCHCGCGQKTNLSNWTDKRIGSVKGQPYKYVAGHSRRYSQQERIIAFWDKVNKDGSIPVHMPHLGKCWEWTACCGITGGYGTFGSGVGNKYIYAHRFSWLINVGKIPDSLFVLHKCDNPKCVNPNHLFLGTKQDNAIDMFSKGRVSRKGEKNPHHKLTDKQIEEIRLRYKSGGITQIKLSEEYGVNQPHISAIVNHKFRK